jgi:hypothetical protein
MRTAEQENLLHLMSADELIIWFDRYKGALTPGARRRLRRAKQERTNEIRQCWSGRELEIALSVRQRLAQERAEREQKYLQERLALLLGPNKEVQLDGTQAPTPTPPNLLSA